MKSLKMYLSSFIALAMITTAVVTLPTQKAQAVDLGPFSVTIGFCQNIQKLGSIINATTIVQWPVAGYPGITMGLLQNTSVVMDFCSYIIQLESLNTTNAIFYSASYLNTLTGKKWDDHLKQADRTWNIANSVYDFESGAKRKGVFESAASYREMSEYINETRQWSSKTFNGRDADVRNRAQRERDMQKFAGAAYRRAIIKDMISCPDPKDNKDYEAIYKKEGVVKKEKDRDDAKEDYMFYKDKLFTMGPKFLASDTEIANFVSEIEQLESSGVAYEVTESSVNESTTKNSPTEVDAEGRPKKVTTSLKRATQKYTAKVNLTAFTNFRNKYSERWKSWVQGRIMANGSFGLLDDPKGRVEREFKEISDKCPTRQLAQGLDPTKANYDEELEKRRLNCEVGVKPQEKEVENLLSAYATELQNALYRYKNNNAMIWTLESQYLGRTRIITATTKDSYKQEEVSCGQNLTPAEMDKLSLKSQSLGNELNQIIAEEAIKTNARESENDRQMKEYHKDDLLRSKVTEDNAAIKRNNDRMNMGISPPRGGIGVKNQ